MGGLNQVLYQSLLNVQSTGSEMSRPFRDEYDHDNYGRDHFCLKSHICCQGKDRVVKVMMR